MAGTRAPLRWEIPLAGVIEAFPTVRQSRLRKLDDCALSLKFELEHGDGWSSHPMARGTLMHRAYAEALRTMRRLDEKRIPVAEALEILYEVCRQRGVPPEEVVTVPLREMRDMRMEMIKFAADNRFDVDRIVDIERRLEAVVTYDSPQGLVERTITGQLDVLMADPPDGAIVIDHKSSWGLPPAGDSEDPSHVSYAGYFQLRTYAFLVFRNYSAVQHLTLREFYPRYSEVREAVIRRDDMEHVEREMSMLVERFDALVASGSESRMWMPTPGAHCQRCSKPGSCPIERESRGEGAIVTEEDAKRYAAEAVVAQRVLSHRRAALKARADARGPIPVKDAKGRRVWGHRAVKRTVRPTQEQAEQARRAGTPVADLYVTKTGTRFAQFVPDASDRGPADPQLESAFKEAAARAKTAPKRKRRRRPTSLG